MGYKVGFLLSLIFIVQLFLMVGDLMAVQFIYTNLDALSVTVGQAISQSGEINEDIERLVENQAGAYIVPIGDENPVFGALYEYKIYKFYHPHYISNEDMEVAVIRSVVIGYYS